MRNPPVTSGFPTQSARYAVIVFITWCQHRLIYILIVLFQYAPFVFKDHEKKNVTMGYCVDMLELLSQMLDFRYGLHDDVIKWKHFPRHWPFVWGIHRSLVNSPWPVNSSHKGHWHGAMVLSLICAWINRWVNNREARDLRRHRAHYDVTVMCTGILHMTLPHVP